MFYLYIERNMLIMTDWNNVEISHSESSKGKKEFMEMLYIKREGTYSINLKTDLVKYNGCYDSMIGYIDIHCTTIHFLEVSRSCETIKIY